MVSAVAVSLLAGAFAVTLLIEFLILRLSRRLNIVAVPNHRSFHDTPTPSVGGLAIVLVACGYLAYSWLAGGAPTAGILFGGVLTTTSNTSGTFISSKQT